MKKYILNLMILAISLIIFACHSTVKTYEPTWESLAQHNIEPEWFKDAKFGIYFTWGPFTVPAFDGEWYPSWMYYPDRKGWGEKIYQYNQDTYGADFDYHDFIPMFKAEHFDAAEWANLFQRACSSNLPKWLSAT